MAVAGIWGNISIYCLNHDNPLEHKLEIMSNTELIKTPFYTCSDNLLKGAEKQIFNKDSHCANRLNLDDYYGLVNMFLKIYEEKGIMSNMTNSEFTYKGARQKIYVKVLEHNGSKIKLGIRNLSVLGGAKK